MKFRNTLFAFLAAMSAAVSFAQAPQVELIPRATFFGNPTKSQGLISPDGKWISWIAPRDLGGRYEPLGEFKGANISVPQGAEIVPGLEQAVAKKG